MEDCASSPSSPAAVVSGSSSRGLMFAALLSSRAKRHVYLFVRDDNVCESLSGGLLYRVSGKIRSVSASHLTCLPASGNEAALRRCGVVFIFVEPDETKISGEWAIRHSREGAVVVSLQSGMRNVSVLQRVATSSGRVLLSGCAAFAACTSIVHGRACVACTSFGPLVVERLSRAKQGVSWSLDVVEEAGIPVLFRHDPKASLWTDLVFRCFDLHAASLRSSQSYSFYELLGIGAIGARSRDRLVLAGLLREARIILDKADIGILDSGASPLGAGLLISELLLRVPAPIAGIFLKVWLRLKLGVRVDGVAGSPHCGGADVLAPRCRDLKLFFNDEITQLATRVGVDCPMHRWVCSSSDASAEVPLPKDAPVPLTFIVVFAVAVAFSLATFASMLFFALLLATMWGELSSSYSYASATSTH